ncbi:hypothetical protein FWH13_00910 [Candidatus Saccharibacteria bacterium]|nr:hypothetical protein [Candidatus Saccharibacteria bacterium]
MLFGVFGWWYGSGLAAFVKWLKNRLQGTADMFSLGLMLKTLFAPFRQIGNEGSDKTGLERSIDIFVSRLISRFIGLMMRSIMLIIGTVVLTLQILATVLALVIYLIIPFLPLVIIGVFIWI